MGVVLNLGQYGIINTTSVLTVIITVVSSWWTEARTHIINAFTVAITDYYKYPILIRSVMYYKEAEL